MSDSAAQAMPLATAAKRKRARVKPLPETDEPVPIGESLGSYDALAVYFSFLFHALVLGAVLLVLWLLDMFYLQDYTPVDPIRAALADETVLDEDPLTETLPLEITTAQTMEIQEDSAVSIAQAISEQSLESAQVMDMVSGSKGNDGEAGLSVWLPKGGNAVTKGSFTAWTDPENPKEGQKYYIIIEVKLPARVKIYRLTDLSGRVVGSDNYRQTLPWDSTRGTWPSMFKDGRSYRVRRTQRIRVKENKIQTRVEVPGAANKVLDIITIRSDTLKEEQTIELRFGESPADRERRRAAGGAGGLGGAGGGLGMGKPK
ncbi:MAG: hypothetical protein AB8G99_07795 [Planctomycetaceae bacterium]